MDNCRYLIRIYSKNNGMIFAVLSNWLLIFYKYIIMNCIHHPLNADGSWHLYSKEELEEMGKRDQKLEDDFWKRFPDIYIDDLDFLMYWSELVNCKTRDELQEVLKLMEDEKREREEYYKNQKTSIWQRLFGH